MANRGCDFEVSVCSSPRTRRGSTLSFPRSTRAAGSGGTLELRVWGYRFRRPICTTSETKVSFGVHPCTVRQWGHWENVILSGSLSISARSISTCVGISLSVVRAPEHQLCHRNLHQSPAKKDGAYTIRDKRSAAGTGGSASDERSACHAN